MTTTLPILWRPRQLSWSATLLLPVLPFLTVVSEAYMNHDGLSGERLVASSLLLVFGLLATWGLPPLLDRLGWQVRKEAEQLRPAWMAGLFVVQIVGLLAGGRDAMEAAGMAFALTCPLIASLTFGAEFQHRTVHGLLSQPVDRDRVWSSKMRVLGVALLLHLGNFELSVLAVGGSFDPELFAVIAGTGLLAWATTPLWTLLTRTLLAGMVFTITVPLVAMALMAFLFDFLRWRGFDFLNARFAEVSWAIAIGMAVVYATVGWRQARARWRSLEAPDPGHGESAGVFIGSGRRSATGVHPAVRRLQGPMSLLVGKELRLQTVTLGAGLLVWACLAFRALVPTDWGTAEILRMLSYVFALVTVLLAGASAIAEERRLGTLEAQVLLPVSRRRQWIVKLAMALGLSLAGLVPILGSTKDLWSEGAWIPLALGWCAFSFALLASSGTESALRAMIGGIVLSVGMTGIVSALFGTVVSTSGHWEGAIWQSTTNDADAWIARARQLGPTDLAGIQSVLTPPSRFMMQLVLTMVGLAAIAPTLLALWFAGRNYARPAGGPALWQRQARASLLLTLLIGLVLGALVIGFQVRTTRAMAMQMVVRHVELERVLTEAERDLARLAFPDRRFLFSASIPLRHRAVSSTDSTDQGAVPAAESPVRWTQSVFRLPLSPSDRALIIEHGYLSDELRDALRKDAAATGSPGATGSGRPPGPWPEETTGGNDPRPVDPRLLRRYGLLPNPTASGGATGTGGVAKDTNAPSPTESISPRP